MSINNDNRGGELLALVDRHAVARPSKPSSQAIPARALMTAMLHATRLRKRTMRSACWERIRTYAKTSSEDTAGSEIEASCSLTACLPLPMLSFRKVVQDTQREVQMKSREFRARLHIKLFGLRQDASNLMTASTVSTVVSAGSRRPAAVPRFQFRRSASWPVSSRGGW